MSCYRNRNNDNNSCQNSCGDRVNKREFTCDTERQVIQHQHVVRHPHEIINEYDVIHEHEFNYYDVVNNREVVTRNDFTTHQTNYCGDDQGCNCGCDCD